MYVVWPRSWCNKCVLKLTGRFFGGLCSLQRKSQRLMRYKLGGNPNCASGKVKLIPPVLYPISGSFNRRVFWEVWKVKLLACSGEWMHDLIQFAECFLFGFHCISATKQSIQPYGLVSGAILECPPSVPTPTSFCAL